MPLKVKATWQRTCALPVSSVPGSPVMVPPKRSAQRAMTWKVSGLCPNWKAASWAPSDTVMYRGTGRPYSSLNSSPTRATSSGMERGSTMVTKSESRSWSWCGAPVRVARRGDENDRVAVVRPGSRRVHGLAVDGGQRQRVRAEVADDLVVLACRAADPRCEHQAGDLHEFICGQLGLVSSHLDPDGLARPVVGAHVERGQPHEPDRPPVRRHRLLVLVAVVVLRRGRAARPEPDTIGLDL